MSDAIVVQRLTKHYGRKRVVDIVNLRVPSGYVYGFLGRNGAGKSTFIKMLLGMVQPDAGHATLLDEDIRQLRPQTRARIAYLAEGHPLYHWMTVGEAVQFTRSFYQHWADQFLENILDHFQISRQQKIGRLSTGQRAQVSLALALGPDLELLILDDPTLGLDAVVRRDFLESMIHLIQRQGRTIFFGSHILGDVERVADRIGIVADGVLRVDRPVDPFKSAVRRVVLEFTGSVPEFPPCPGLVSQRQLGGKLELVMTATSRQRWSNHCVRSRLKCWRRTWKTRSLRTRAIPCRRCLCSKGRYLHRRWPVTEKCQSCGCRVAARPRCVSGVRDGVSVAGAEGD